MMIDECADNKNQSAINKYSYWCKISLILKSVEELRLLIYEEIFGSEWHNIATKDLDDVLGNSKVSLVKSAEDPNEEMKKQTWTEPILHWCWRISTK